MEPDAKHEQQEQGEELQQAEQVEVKQQEDKPEDNTDLAPNDETSFKEVDDEELRARLLQMLEESDLSTVTEKMLRKQLEEQLGVKLTDKKQLIRQEVMAFLAKQQPHDWEEGEQGEADGTAEEEQGGEEEEEEDQGKKPRKRRNNSQLGSVLSEPLQAFLGVESMTRPQVVKAIWDYIKANNLQDPKDKRSILPDEKLSTILTPPVTMFSMNKQLSKHVFNKDSVVGSGGNSDEEGEEQQRRPAKKPRKSSGAGSSSSRGGSDSGSDEEGDEQQRRPANKPRKSSGAGSRSRAKAKGGGEGGEGEKVLRGYAKPLRVSQELAAVTGQPEMSRGTLMKWLYAYITEKDLKDPSDKRYVISDEALKKLTGESRFKAFGAQKLFNKHFPKT